MLKRLGIAVSTLVVAVTGVLGYLVMRKPAMAAAPSIKVEMTPENIERGRQVFLNSECYGCHSERDWSKFSGPVIPGREAVGVTFPPEMGMPGTVSSANLTPDPETGLGNWTDGEKIRAIREGVSRDGRALFPMMPYAFYRNMSDEDVYALVAYLNSLRPVRNPRPPTKLSFPVGLMIKSAPQPVTQPVPHPDRKDAVAYGKYLVTMGGCMDCHTQEEKGEFKMDMAFAGGREFNFGQFSVRTANITPDEETGIGTWTEQRFVSKFRNYSSFANGAEIPRHTQANFTLMPWVRMSQRSEDDLRAIFAYLRTLKAVRNPVEKHPAVPAS